MTGIPSEPNKSPLSGFSLPQWEIMLRTKKSLPERKFLQALFTRFFSRGMIET